MPEYTKSWRDLVSACMPGFIDSWNWHSYQCGELFSISLALASVRRSGKSALIFSAIKIWSRNRLIYYISIHSAGTMKRQNYISSNKKKSKYENKSWRLWNGWKWLRQRPLLQQIKNTTRVKGRTTLLVGSGSPVAVSIRNGLILRQPTYLVFGSMGSRGQVCDYFL